MDERGCRCVGHVPMVDRIGRVAGMLRPHPDRCQGRRATGEGIVGQALLLPL
jgi:hypothetical protein